MDEASNTALDRHAATSERVVFIGNCQLEQLCHIFRESTGATAQYVPSYEALSEHDRATLATADRFVWQVTEFEQRVGVPDDSRPCHLVPLVTGQFLFPLSGDPHPHNPERYFLPAGPYPGEMGDSVLSACAISGGLSDAVVRRYLGMDIGAQKHIRRMTEITLDRQAQRDRRAGRYRCAGIIDARMRDEPLFLTRGHLRAPLVRHMAECLMEDMELPPDLIAEADCSRFVPLSELPIHPSIRSTLGIRYEAPDFTFHDEGRFTIEEWAGRYLHCAWSAALYEGLWLFHHARVGEALPLLERGVAECPRSEVGQAVLNVARRQLQSAGR